ncbi:15805_t:CDS:2, partial [Racocetra persica]
ELIKTGDIIQELHYGLYLRDWWFFSDDNLIPPIPIHLGLEIMIQLNKKPFIICVVRYIHSPLQPEYICEGSGQSSSIVTSASTAIISVYQMVFSTKAKFSGLVYLGLNQDKTAQKLLENITFYPFIIKLENISIFVGSLGKILYSNPNKVGCRYMASLFYKYKAKQSVFSQYIRDNLYTITIYQNSQIIAKYNDSSPNAIWQQTGILKSIPGNILFAINHPTTLQKLKQAYEIKFLHQTPIPNQCTYTDWDNKIIMEHLFELHLNKAVIFCAAGCTEITPYNKEISEVEFWTNAPNPGKDRDTLRNLYEDGFLNISSQTSSDKEIISQASSDKAHISLQIFPDKIFWNCFRDSYDANSIGIDGKISPNTINNARKFSRINRPGCIALEKPIITRSKMSVIKEKEFELFFNNKDNVNMSSYKVDHQTNLSVLYLKDQKNALWKKFSATYPDRMKRTSFMARLQNSCFQYREDLGGLCMTCNDYGYQPFEDLIEIINSTFSYKTIRDDLINKMELLRRHLKRNYEKELVINKN